MDIRRVDIENFRGIRRAVWRLPAGQSFVALIGPGDSAKSSILTALDMALSDRWNISISDTDFYMTDVRHPISIRVALSDLSAELRQHDVLGMCLSGIDDSGELFEDPEEEHEPCVIIALSVDKELEPKWTVHRPDKSGPETILSASARRLFGAYKVDERIDAHLRWSRTSALGRLTEAKHGTNELLATASRTAREAVSQAIPPELSGLTVSIQERLHQLGSGEFHDLQPGLDQSLTTSNGNLALYEGPVPLTSYGLGSRRLAGVATQQLAHAGKGVLLVDEIEYGLEPHRLVNLLTQFKSPGAYSLAVATTHSPTALRQVGINDLGVVRRETDGAVTVRSFTPDDAELQALLRAAPEAFLARRIVVCEGKTEHGMALELVDCWDQQRAAAGEPVAAGLGVVVVDGQGGSKAVKWAGQLRGVGYEVVLFIDSDVEADRRAADALASDGVHVVRWQDGHNTERAVCEVLDASGLATMLERAVVLHDDPASAPGNLLAQLKSHALPAWATSLNVAEWIAGGLSINEAREAIADAAHKGRWFKRVDKGKELARILLTGSLAGADAEQRLTDLRAAVYPVVPARPDAVMDPPEVGAK